MTSKQMDAFKVNQEPPAVQERYGIERLRPRLPDGSPTGRSRASRLWKSISAAGTTIRTSFRRCKDDKLPIIDNAMSALVEDLEQRGLLQDTAIIWMGEFGRTPRINGNAGRDHWARAWSVVLGGAGMQRRNRRR